MNEATRARVRMKRRFARLTVRVEVLLEGPGGCQRHLATTLGAGGLFVATDAPHFAGTPLTVRLCLPGEQEELRFDARVAWSELPGEATSGTSGMGLEFTDPGARNRFASRLERWAKRSEAGSGLDG